MCDTQATTTLTFPLAFCDRLRMATDGVGVTTLVGAYGCPLRCRKCINPRTWQSRDDGRPPYVSVTPPMLYDRVKQDNLYYLATGGGVTFGGGEPLVHARFIEAFRAFCPAEWRLRAETCLHIDPELVPICARVIDEFFVDIKDMDPCRYTAYTGRDNARVKANLRTLLTLVGADRVVVRVPRIPGFNSDRDVACSVRELTAMGITRMDCFTYKEPT